jgi:hypothetical protein
MRKLIILRGEEGAASAWANAKLAGAPGAYARVDADGLRQMLFGRERSRSDDAFVRGQRDSLVLAALDGTRDVILQDSKLDREDERHLRGLVHGIATVEIVQAGSGSGAGSVGIDERPEWSERKGRRHGRKGHRPRPPKYEPDPNLPPAVICDLDGTLALLGRRSPYDTSRCEEDDLNPVVAGILSSLVQPRPAILLVSGREARFREQTVRWLARHNIDYDELHMRPTGDFRKDTLIKQEIFEREVRHRFRVEFVLDDRNQVVEMWRSLGLTCLQVAEGDF